MHVCGSIKRGHDEWCKTKRLVVIHFDYMILENRADMMIQSLVPRRYLPEPPTGLFNWLEYMKELYHLLYNRNVSKLMISNEVLKIKPLKGIKTFLKRANDEFNCDIIIISDSNTYFIDIWLKAAGLFPYIMKIFANPAEFKDNFLKVTPFHYNHKCKLSAINLCKGKVLMDFIKEHSQEHGVHYDRIVMIAGDEDNFCPLLKLRSKDIACLRHGFPIIEMVQNVLRAKENLKKTKQWNYWAEFDINCELFMWSDGDCLLNFFIERFGRRECNVFPRWPLKNFKEKIKEKQLT